MADHKMELVTELLKKMTVNNFNIGSSCWVDVTYIKNPQSFYVRPTSYRKYLPEIQGYSDYLKKQELSKVRTIIYESKMLQSYIRGEIQCIQNNEDAAECQIFAIDYGFVEHSVPLKCIRRPDNCNYIPSLVTHCQLADCKPLNNTWTDKSIEAMKFYIGKESIKMEVRGRDFDKLIVDLRNSCPDDIATMLALTGYSTLGYGENTINRFVTSAPNFFTKHYFLYKELKVDEVLHVRVQSGKSLDNFYVAEMSDYKQYLNERENFTYFMKKQKQLQEQDLLEENPVGILNDVICCKYERAIIKKVILPQNKALVQLVDWGTCKEVNFLEIKPMSDKFFFYPAAAIYCSAVEKQVWDTKLQHCLIPGHEFLITVKEVGNNNQPNIVSISPINTKY